jgi:hypothetical protein
MEVILVAQPDFHVNWRTDPWVHSGRHASGPHPADIAAGGLRQLRAAAGHCAPGNPPLELTGEAQTRTMIGNPIFLQDP